MSDVALKYQNASLLPWQLRGIWNVLKNYLIFWKYQLLPIIRAGNE